jgi:hypothetical protein
LISLAIATYTGVIDMSLAIIKGYDLKSSLLSYDYHYIKDDIFTVRENVVRNTNYEDAYFGLTSQYPIRLKKDIQKIIENNQEVTGVNINRMEVRSDLYTVKICVEDYQLKVRDTTFFKKMVSLNMLSYFELYDAECDKLLLSTPTRKVHIQNKFIYKGFASEAFIHNKTTEHWMAQLFQYLPYYLAQHRDYGPNETLADNQSAEEIIPRLASLLQDSLTILEDKLVPQFIYTKELVD